MEIAEVRRMQGGSFVEFDSTITVRPAQGHASPGTAA
jgi:hypothetical protein